MLGTNHFGLSPATATASYPCLAAASLLYKGTLDGMRSECKEIPCKLCGMRKYDEDSSVSWNMVGPSEDEARDISRIVRRRNLGSCTRALGKIARFPSH